jgi:AcrR family transcriptional regulator
VQAILEGADRVLRAQGASFAMRDVARIAGVSVGTLYQYYATRAALLAAWEELAFEHITQRVLGLVQRLVEAGPPLEVSIYVVTVRTIELVLEHMSVYPRTEMDGLFSRSAVRQDRQEHGAVAICTSLGFAGDQHRIRPSDRQAAARVAIYFVTHFPRELVHSPLPPECRPGLIHQAALMMVHTFVTGADESLFRQLDVHAFDPKT